MDYNQRLQRQAIVLYQTKDGAKSVDVIFGDETFWLNQKDMAKLFDADRTVITKHLKNIFLDGELDENSVCAKIAHTASDGKKYNTNFTTSMLLSLSGIGLTPNRPHNSEFGPLILLKSI